MKAIYYWLMWLCIFTIQFYVLWGIAHMYNTDHVVVATVVLLLIDNQMLKLADKYGIVSTQTKEK